MIEETRPADAQGVRDRLLDYSIHLGELEGKVGQWARIARHRALTAGGASAGQLWIAAHAFGSYSAGGNENLLVVIVLLVSLGGVLAIAALVALVRFVEARATVRQIRAVDSWLTSAVLELERGHGLQETAP